MPRALVIDDQKDVRTVMRMVLQVHRYDVVEAETAAAGLRAFAESGFDIVLVDLFLEDASGFDVVAQLRAAAPAQPVVVVSGMTTLEGELPGDVIRLQKPFRPGDLVSAITRAQGSADAPVQAHRIAV